MSTTANPNHTVIQNASESKPKRVRKPKVAPQQEETPEVKQEKPKTQKAQKKEKAPKTPKVVEEPESCGVCMDNYTAIIRKKCICKFCKADTCSKCIERYLLDRHEDAHCLHCRVNYNDATLHEICTKTYLQHTYFKHRQEVLINRERANLPGLQDVAIQERKKRKDKEKIAELQKEIDEIHKQRDQVLNEYNTIYTKYYSALSASAKMIAEASKTGKKADAEDESMVKDTINDLRKKLDEGNKRSDEFRRQIDDRQTKINMIRWPHHYGIQGDNGASVKKPEEERKKFIRRCTRDGCQGFLSTAWKCGICEFYSCGNCFATKTKKHDDPHECKKEDVETAEMIKKDSKPCPNCGEFIMKTSGCFAKDTPILMWDGSTKMSQDITINDELVGDDGTKRTVLDTTNGVDTMYEVKQSTGLSYMVNSKHTLVLKYSGEKNISWNSKEQSWNIRWFDRNKLYSKTHTVKTSAVKSKEEAYTEITEFKNTLDFSEDIEIIVDDYIKLNKSDKQKLYGYKSSGINWEKKDVLLDPYLMGVYLGDGINDGMSFAINADSDPEILEYIINWANQHDSEVVHDDMYRFRVRRRGNKQNIQKAIGRGATCDSCNGCKKKICKWCDTPNVEYNDLENHKTSRKNQLSEYIEYYGLLRNKKFIPSDYLINDKDTRLKLLAGIIDTDGHLDKANEGKRIMIVSSNKKFAEQIVLLSRSLGFNTTIRSISKKGVSFKKGGEKKDYDDHYQINISGNICEIPTLIARKKCISSTPNKDWMRTRIELSEIGPGEYYGWKVNGNSKFLLNDTTVLRNCDQMFCISCQTPWSWTSGKVVTSGPIHNPHYYEWMKRNGTAPARNPADVPCGGYPAAWELVRMPSGMRNAGQPFFEFHRICQELQDVSERTYRSHIDQTSTNNINVKFLLGDFDEKHWGQQLGKDERKKKRDREVQEIFAAFRMVAVELINRVQNYRNGRLTFTHLPTDEAEKFLKDLYVEIDALITMINDALRNVSISYSYSVPYIQMDGKYYNIKTKNFSDEVKKKRPKAKDDDSVADTEADEEKVQSETLETVEAVQRNQVIETVNTVQRRRLLSDNYPVDSDSDSDSDISSDSEVDNSMLDEDAALQQAIAKSLGIQP